MSRGLVLSPITDEATKPDVFQPEGYARLDVFAGHVTLKRPCRPPGGPPAARRGKVRGLSQKSRNRLLKRLSATRGLQNAFFVTLTYPDQFPISSGDQYRDLKVFIQRLLHHYPDAGYIWKKEYKKRRSGVNKGLIAPHWHLFILIQHQSLASMRKWVSQAWFEVVGSGDERHLAAGTNVQRIKNMRHAMHYASKYIAKVTDSDQPEETGRIWGSGGILDREASVSVWVTRQQFIELKRMMSAWLRSKGNRYSRRLKRRNPSVGFTVFGLGDESGPLECQGIDAVVLKFILAAVWGGA